VGVTIQGANDDEKRQGEGAKCKEQAEYAGCRGAAQRGSTDLASAVGAATEHKCRFPQGRAHIDIGEKGLAPICVGRKANEWRGHAPYTG
jgi:hypothetical protein